MNYETSKRYSLTEIGLLAFFVLSLIAAQMVVKVRQRIVLSEPITLAGSGLSVCKPVSAGWESTASWQYGSDNSLTLVAQQFQGTNREVEILWHYQLCSPTESTREILQRRAEQASAIFGEVQTLEQPIPMDFAPIHAADRSGRTFYVGIAKLDFGRSIELQVLPRRADLFFAENLFRTLASSIDYQPSPQLQGGKDLTADLWDSLQNNLLPSGGKDHDAFVIKNAQKQPLGFYYNQYAYPGGKTNGNLQLSNRQYDLKLSMIDSSLSVNSDEKTFLWKSTVQQIGLGQPRNYTITKESDGALKVDVDFDSDQNRQYQSNCLLVPELLLPQAAKLFLENVDDSTEQTDRTVVVDVLSAQGFVVPTILEKVDPANALAKSEDIASVVKVDFLNHPQSFEELYFDADGQLIGRLEQQPLKRLRLWERTTPNELQRLFQDNFKAGTDTVASSD